MPASPGGLASRLIKHLSRARKSLPAPSSSSRGTARPYDDIKQAAKDVWRSTFGQLEREPVYETIPLRRGAGRRLPNGQYWNAREIHTSSVHAGTRARGSAPLVQNARFLAGRIRPHAQSIRGPGMVGHTGLLPSPARTFATYGSTKFVNEIVGNVPLGFRALADRMKRRERSERQMTWRNKVRENGRGGQVERSLKKFEKMRGGSRFLLAAGEIEKVDKEIKRVREYKKYFVLPQLEDNRSTLPLILSTTEEETPTHDPRSTTYLLLPLSPSLAHLISLTPQPLQEYENASYFHPHHPGRMTDPLPAMSQAYTQHAQQLGPLLEALGERVHLQWEDQEPWLSRYAIGSEGKEQGEVQVRTILDSYSGEPEALRLSFPGWTRAGVERLVRSLRSNEPEGGEEWWYCYTVPSDPIEIALSESESISFSNEVSTFSSPSQSMCESFLTSPSGSIIEENDELTWEESVWRMPLLNERGETELSPGLEVELDLEQVERSVWSEL